MRPPDDGGGGGAPRALDAAMAALWERFRGTMDARVEAVENAVAELLEGRLDAGTRRTAEREAHKLAGAVGTFGYPEASRLAREAEEILAGTAPLEPGRGPRLGEIVVALRRELEKAPVPPGEASPVPAPAGPAGARLPERPLLLIVDADAELAERLAVEAEGRGLRTRVAASLAGAREALARERPQAALLDLALEGRAEDGMALLAELGEMQPPVPAVVLTARSSFVDRVEVARHGGRGFLQKPARPEQVVETVVAALERLSDLRSAVLAVDDDPAVLASIASLLAPRGVQVTGLADPRSFWEALESTNPDVVVLDVDMPGINGLELCRVLRNDPRWEAVPVVFLTARADAGTVARVFSAGADDYVPKPIVGPELVTRIANRLERVHLLRHLADTDPLTGVANRRRSSEQMEQFLRLAERHGQPLSLALIDLDRFKAINDRWGHALGDEVLRRTARLLTRHFRAEDVVARWGGEEFVVAMYGMDKDDGVQRVAEALERFRDEGFGPEGQAFSATFSAGVAQYPADGTDVTSLYRAADAALYAAKDTGRNRVLPAGWSAAAPDQAERLDVLVVEDDAAVARLLLHSLETRGYRTRWIDDGAEAARALTGSAPEVRASVVLLDVDLPGMDGYAVLRALARERVLDRSRVIVLTVRSHEAEVLQALEAGAFDHVSKPFSVPVLLQRVRRAIRT